MNRHQNLRLKELAVEPTIHILEKELGDSFAAYKKLQEALPGLEIQQEWQWYTPYKAWFARGQHRWTTPRGTKKEKTLYWLHVFEGFFSVAVWFKEKNRTEILTADVSEKTIERIRGANTMGKLPTFPVEFDITASDMLGDVYTLLDCKKRLEL
ncbi:MAG: DUF3788 domain-containing protein [Defluviitaleaceae bacterium]|nr:DUF3788 domain-containing protein [Defluviitaleaceae bacterium]